MIHFILLFVSGYQYTDGTQVAVTSEDNSYVYTKPVYKQKISDPKIKNNVAQYLWQQSPLRAMMVGVTNRPKNQTQNSNSTSLVKRNAALGVGMAVGMSGHSMVTMVQAFSTKNITSQQRANMFMGAAYDMTATILMFAGGPPGILIGSVMMITKTFFDAFDGEKSPPQIDPDAFFKQIVDYIQQVIPTADQMYMEMKAYVTELTNNIIDMRFQKQYQDNQQKSLRVISEYLNIFDGEQESEKILTNWETLVTETAREMINNKLPLSVDDPLNFEIYETATAVAVYPQFVSMLIMAVKEWYLTAKQLGKSTKNIESKFKSYVAAFRKQYEAMVNSWYTTSKAYIETSHFEKGPSDSDICLLTMKVPNAADAQGYIPQSNAAHKYVFNKDTTQEFTGITENTCPDPNCRFVTILDDRGENVCTYEKTYDENCKKPCSKARQAFSWLMPVFGAGKSECFLNKNECKNTQNGIKIRQETCKPSNCTIQMNLAKEKLMSRLEDNVAKARQTVVRYNTMLDKADITDMTNFIDGLQRMQSMSLQAVVPKDEIFNGDVCHGLLAVPKSLGVPKMCIVAKKTKYSCPTMKSGTRQYILYPDVIRSKLPKLCPKYLRPKSDVMTKKKIEAAINGTITDEQFLVLKQAKEEHPDIVNSKGKKQRNLSIAKQGITTKGEKQSTLDVAEDSTDDDTAAADTTADDTTADDTTASDDSADAPVGDINSVLGTRKTQ